MDANAHTSLGKVLYELGRYEESRDIYRQAIYLDSSKSQAYHEQREALLNKGKALYELGRFEDALAAYEQSISFDPDSKDAFVEKGRTLDKLLRYKELALHSSSV